MKIDEKTMKSMKIDEKRQKQEEEAKRDNKNYI